MLLLSGARQTGKTTIFRQSIGHLLKDGIEPTDIIYVTFDHPILRLAGVDRTLDAWREAYPGSDKKRFLFLDEIQFLKEWETWVKHHVDFKRQYRIAATGSATSLKDGSIESGLGRIETIPLPTMSFREFLQLRNIANRDRGVPWAAAHREGVESRNGAQLGNGDIQLVCVACRLLAQAVVRRQGFELHLTEGCRAGRAHSQKAEHGAPQGYGENAAQHRCENPQAHADGQGDDRSP
ncbi:MAG: AAA family ATPase [Rhizobiales bacterium]|nr:AAA family ATPase [Hyphomicrobiales bacterium]